MARLVVIVDLEVQAENVDAFIEAAVENAEQSVRLEPGCYQFDVVCGLEDKTKITLYEVYEDADAFQAHTKMPHTATFLGNAKSMVVKQAPRRGQLLAAPKK